MVDKKAGAPAKKQEAQITAAEAKATIKEIEEVTPEKSGVPEDIEESVKRRFLQHLKEQRTDLTESNRMADWLYIPEVIRLKSGGTRRITKHISLFGSFRYMTPDGNYFLRWCHPSRFDRHLRRGFSFIEYDKMFGDTNYFVQTAENRIRNGDLYLMKISVDGFARIQREKLDLQSHYARYHEGSVTDMAEKFNTKAFRYDPSGNTKSLGDVEFIN
jgi:hypothetical protein